MAPFHRACAILLLVSFGPILSAQEDHRIEELGLSFSAPGADWKQVGPEARPGGGLELAFEDPQEAERKVSLIVWRLAEVPAIQGLCDSELRQMGARGQVEELLRFTRSVAGRDALAVRYRLDREAEGVVWLDASYFRTELFLGRLAVSVRMEQLDQLDTLVDGAIQALRIETPEPEPIQIDDPVPGNVLTVVHGGSAAELVHAYLEALPGAARANGGDPVIIAVGAEIGPTARAFIRKYRPAQIRLIGPDHPLLPQARPARDQWEAGGTVVVCDSGFGNAAQAACLAARLDVPLLIDRGDLARRLEDLTPTRVLALGDVPLAGVERISGPADVARVAGGADYLALCSVAESAGRGTAALAAVLAAARDGVVLGLERAPAPRSIPLERTDECPPGLESVPGTGHYLTARFEAGGREVLAGAVQTTVVRVASNDSPRYGRLRIDLDGDGRLEEDEEPRIGSVIELGGRALHLTYHYGHAFVGYLRDALVLDPLDPGAIQDRIRGLVAELGGAEFLAIVGTPKLVPFHYQEATGYFESYDIKQELPSDAPYANLDDDSYLELAVGRLPVEDLFEGSAAVATTVAYHRLAEEEWSSRATMIQPGFHELEGELPWVLPNAEALIRGIQGDLDASGVESSSFYRDQVEMDDVLGAMSGSGWIAYFNHSGPGSWGIHPGAAIVTAPADQGKNRSLPELDGAPIVFGGGCSSAALDVGQPLARTFPGRFFELGAVSYLGNTRVAYARSEHLVQLYFARLASGGSSLGQAYRDSRNYLAHLLDHGHLLGGLEWGVDLGVRDFLRGQYLILNLFGDPALRPVLPPGAREPVQVELAATDRPGQLRLQVTNRGQGRLDPVLMMPASGQGRPREFQVRTGPGLTSSHLPHQFVGDGLSPVRSVAEVQPGAWVDVELPRGAHDVRVRLASGPDFADRGYSVVPGARGEPRLLMYVPLVRSTLEHGDGSSAARVEFDVAFRRKTEERLRETAGRQEAPRILIEEAWSPPRGRSTQVEPGAQEILDRVDSRHGRALEAGRTRTIPWTLSNPQPRFYGEHAFFTGTWDGQGRSEITPHALPPHLAPRSGALAKAIQEVVDLPFRSPLPSLEGRSVALGGSGVLVLTPLEPSEGDESIEVHVLEDGTVERILEHQFGLSMETRFEWLETEHGPVLTSCTRRDPVRPHKVVAHRVEYVTRGDLPLPLRITLEMQGMLPRPLHIEFSYNEVL